eukprot:CAMPEP_0172172392 /NCGR_PEP_ID=MMETSP1050-20130122/12420_1 /TAXON_ID=233186 /ORGANISM="Cryptomonas curvata, Strain CCAP979/52" /LENGTH=290 /DNA_ID=CAMNT_0012843925 /DNA_START=103 /DNA_END=973 /DNA_ORIENTATION=+
MSKDIKDLVSLIDMRGLECLNEQTGHSIKNAIEEPMRLDNAVFLSSDCDQQLLINVRFQQSVKLHSISLTALNAECAPKSLKIFVNPMNIGFDEAESQTSTQTVEFTPDQVAEGSVVPLKFVKFQSVTTLAIFIGENFGDKDRTVVHSLKFYGCPRDLCDMKDWDKVKKLADVRRGLRQAQADASPACPSAPLLDKDTRSGVVPLLKGLRDTAGGAHDGNRPRQQDRPRWGGAAALSPPTPPLAASIHPLGAGSAVGRRSRGCRMTRPSKPPRASDGAPTAPRAACAPTA